MHIHSEVLLEFWRRRKWVFWAVYWEFLVLELEFVVDSCWGSSFSFTESLIKCRYNFIILLLFIYLFYVSCFHFSVGSGWWSEWPFSLQWSPFCCSWNFKKWGWLTGVGVDDLEKIDIYDKVDCQPLRVVDWSLLRLSLRERSKVRAPTLSRSAHKYRKWMGASPGFFLNKKMTKQIALIEKNKQFYHPTCFSQIGSPTNLSPLQWDLLEHKTLSSVKPAVSSFEQIATFVMLECCTCA